MQVPAMDSGHPISGGVAGTGLDSGAIAVAGWAGLPLTVFCADRRVPCTLRAAGFDFGWLCGKSSPLRDCFGFGEGLFLRCSFLIRSRSISSFA